MTTEDDAKAIEAAIAEQWANYQCSPSAMWFDTPFGCLYVTSQTAILVGDEGEELEDQADAAAAFAWLKETYKEAFT